MLYRRYIHLWIWLSILQMLPWMEILSQNIWTISITIKKLYLPPNRYFFTLKPLLWSFYVKMKKNVPEQNLLWNSCTLFLKEAGLPCMKLPAVSKRVKLQLSQLSTLILFLKHLSLHQLKKNLSRRRNTTV